MSGQDCTNFPVHSMCHARMSVSGQELKVDTAQRLRTAMWRFRSGLSHKRALQGAAEKPPDAEEQALRELWEVALPHVETWSQAFLDKRFHHL